MTYSAPAKLTATTPPGCTQAGGVITCEIGTLLPAPTASRTVTATVSSTAPSGPVNHPACHSFPTRRSSDLSVTCSEPDVATVEVASNLAIGKTVTPTNVNAGDVVTY